jgi:hypothetical protein
MDVGASSRYRPVLPMYNEAQFVEPIANKLDFTHFNCRSSGLAAGRAEQALDFSYVLYVLK